MTRPPSSSDPVGSVPGSRLEIAQKALRCAGRPQAAREDDETGPERHSRIEDERRDFHARHRRLTKKMQHEPDERQEAQSDRRHRHQPEACPGRRERGDDAHRKVGHIVACDHQPEGEEQRGPASGNPELREHCLVLTEVVGQVWAWALAARAAGEVEKRFVCGTGVCLFGVASRASVRAAAPSSWESRPGWAAAHPVGVAIATMHKTATIDLMA